MAQLDVHLTAGGQDVASLTLPGRLHYFMEIDHKIFSTVLLSLPLIQEEQLVFSFWQKNVNNTG